MAWQQFCCFFFVYYGVAQNVGCTCTMEWPNCLVLHTVWSGSTFLVFSCIMEWHNRLILLDHLYYLCFVFVMLSQASFFDAL